MADELAAALATLVRKWAPDPETRSALAVVLEALAGECRREAEPTPAASPPPPPPVAVPVPAVVSPPAPPEPPPPPIATLPPLTFKPPAPIQPPSPPVTGDIVPQALPVIAARSRLKADAARLVARRLSGEVPADDRAAQADLTRRAAEWPDSYLWLLDWGHSERPGVWTDLAGAFDAAADAAEMLRLWKEMPDADAGARASEVLHLAAEAQAVLFAAAAAAGRAKPDIDQLNLFVTIREEAASRRVFVSRYLRRDDPADPAAGPAVARRVAALTASLRQVGDAARNRQKYLKNIRYKVGKMRDDPGSAAGEWPRVLELIDELVGGGLPPSNAELRDALLPVVDLLPGEVDLSRNAALVFREIDAYLASRPDEPVTAAAPEPLGPEAAEVAALLRGRELVLIGGLVRPEHKAALIAAFGLSDLRWVTVPEHSSFTVFEPDIARPEVALVLLATRWVSHDYQNVRRYCDEYGKPLVKLPAGYHPNQVAHQILIQAGNRLRAAG